MSLRNLLLVFLLVLSTIATSARKKKKAAEVIAKDQIAFNSLRFGATPTEYHCLYPDSVQKIGDYTYIFRPTFTNNKLISLDIVTQREDAKEFKKYGLEGINAMVAHFTTKFGPAMYQWYVPALTSFETYQKSKISNWQIGTKVIDIYVTKCTYEYYQGICTITNNPGVTAALNKQ
jgi:hypothetical protein